MTESEILCIVFGVELGVLVMITVQILADTTAARPGERRRAALTRKHVATDGWHTALADRPLEPHPAELLEAAVRDFELDLLDAMDRLDNAAGRDDLP